MVPSCSPSPGLSNELEFCRIPTTSSLLASEVGRRPQPDPGEHAYGVLPHGRKNAPAFGAKSPRISPTQGRRELAIVASCSPSLPLSIELEYSRMKMTTSLLASDIGGHPQPAPDEHAYGVFVHG